MYPVEATTVRHSRIHFNLIGYLQRALDKTSCEAVGSTVRLKLSDKRYAYPDIMVVCDGIELEDEKYDTVLNPSVIIEVLSPSTGDFDRGGKADLYRSLPTLREYVIVAQDRMFVQRYGRQAEHQWSLLEYTHPDSVLRLESIGVDIPLSANYQRAEFDPAS